MPSKKPDIPKPTGSRLSRYLRFLETCKQQGRKRVSSREIGEGLSLTPTQVRKDLAIFGQFGHAGAGYTVSNLLIRIQEILGSDRLWPVAIVGMGNLGRALAQRKGYELKGFRVAALFDVSPDVVGKVIEGIVVGHVEDFTKTIKERNIELGIICVPGAKAQSTVDMMVKAGIKGILNFTHVHLAVPEDIAFLSVDLTVLLEQLTFQITHNIPSRGSSTWMAGSMPKRTDSRRQKKQAKKRGK